MSSLWEPVARRRAGGNVLRRGSSSLLGCLGNRGTLFFLSFFVLFCFYGVSLPGLLVISSAALIASVLRECRPSSCGCPHVAHAPFFLSLCTSRLLRGLERVVVNNTCRLFVLAFFFFWREKGERGCLCARTCGTSGSKGCTQRRPRSRPLL